MKIFLIAILLLGLSGRVQSQKVLLNRAPVSQNDSLRNSAELKSTAASNVLNVQMPTVIPPSPNAAALAIYADYPVSHYTGVPNINIPLYEVNVDGYKLPISLSYHASGIRPSQEASWVGLGWSLNAGGVISRTIKCYDDFLEYGAYAYRIQKGYFEAPEIKEPNMLQLTEPVPYQLSRLIVDSEPDIFYYNLPDCSGKFLISQTKEIILFDKDKNVKILFNKDVAGKYSFTIITPDGVQYIFKEMETTISLSAPGRINFNNVPGKLDGFGDYEDIQKYTSSWYLSKIITINKREINFIYEDEIYLSPAQEILVKYTKSLFSSGTDIQHGSMSNNKQKQYNKRLVKITWDNGYITFPASGREDMQEENSNYPNKKIDEINIYNNNNDLIEGYKFNYDYFNKTHDYNRIYDHVMKRLKLLSIEEIGINNKKRQLKNSFKYIEGVLPPKNTNSKDYWGYYNGREYGPEFYASVVFGGKIYSGAEKSSDFNHLKIGILNEIKHPTGASTVFTFEENAGASNLLEFQPLTVSENIFHVYNYATQDEYPRYPSTISDTFYVNKNTVGALTIDFSVEDRRPNRTTYHLDYPIARLRKIGPTIKTINTINVPLTLQGEYQGTTTKADGLSEGTYVFEALTPPGDMYIIWKLKYEGATKEKNNNGIINGGGLRIAKIQTGDKVRKFNYNNTGIFISSPIYQGITTIGQYVSVEEESTGGINVGGGMVYVMDQYVTQTSETKNPLTGFCSGNHVGYRVVEESVMGNSDSLKTRYQFYNDYEESYGGNIPGDIKYTNGKIHHIGYFQNNSEIKFIDYEYERVLAPIVNAGYFGNPEAVISGPRYYSYNIEWFQKKEENVSLLDKTTGEYITDFKSYEYNDYAQLRSLNSYTSESGGTYTEMYKYVTDYMDGINGGMKDKHMIGIPIETIKLRNNKVIAAQKTIYKDTLGTYLPKTIDILNTASPLSLSNYSQYYKPEISFDKYTSQGKSLQMSASNGSSVVYLWGYNHQYPIAEIKGTTYDNIKSALGFTADSQLEALASELSPDVNGTTGIGEKLRAYFKNKEVLVTTYTYKPLVGIETMTDPRGVKTTYNYDTFGRLKEIRDHNNNLVETYDYHYQNQ